MTTTAHKHVESVSCGPAGECVQLHIAGEAFCFAPSVASWLADHLNKSADEVELSDDDDAEAFEEGWSQCEDYYNCGGCCSAGRDLIRS